MSTVAVTGGAGYIGSNVCKALLDKGYKVIVLDDFSSGIVSRIQNLDVEIKMGSILDRNFLINSLKNVDSVIHLAAKKSVEESVQNPLMYYLNNVSGTLNVISAMLVHRIKQIVFSSTAVVYASTSEMALKEDSPKKPISPYAQSKLFIENFLQELREAEELSSICLRYFNVVGSGGKGLGDKARDNLVPKVFAALTSGQTPEIYGSDYQTKDGTCIRDYVHVKDLADAHVAALEFLLKNEVAEVFNVGSGKGYSVKEVMDQIRITTNIDFQPRLAARRSGDPDRLIADIEKIETMLGWKPISSLSEMIESAWNSYSAKKSE